MWRSVTSRAWGCSVLDIVARCFGRPAEGVAGERVAVYSESSAGESSEGGTEEGYSGLPEVPAVLGRSAGVHFADVHSACVARCLRIFAEENSEVLQHAAVVHSDEVWGWELFAADCSVRAEGGWKDWDQWSCCYLC